MNKKPMCANCKKRYAQQYDDVCKECAYKRTMQYTMDQPAEDRDWSFAHCEECGSSLDSVGECRNTWCGNSPYQGTDWV